MIATSGIDLLSRPISQLALSYSLPSFIPSSLSADLSVSHSPALVIFFNNGQCCLWAKSKSDASWVAAAHRGQLNQSVPHVHVSNVILDKQSSFKKLKQLAAICTLIVV